jgi:glycosyltransferase involved in cell wall biosynthesis
MHKVLVDLHRLGGNRYNGLYHFCYQLGLHFAAALPADMDLQFYVPKEIKGMFGDKVNYTIQRSRDKHYRFGTRQFAVWHVATTLSWYRPFNRKTKNIYTIHDLNFLKEEEYSESNKRKYLNLIQQRVKRADHLTYISKFAFQQAKANLDLGNKPYTIIYNGCNVPLPPPYKAPAYQPAKSFLFTIGQLHARKNFHVLPSLLAHNDHELIIAGLNDFPYTQKVLAEAKRWNVSDRVKLAGPITDEEKHWYYQNCLAFVFPSAGEGFGLPVLEAMHFGKPVFLSRLTSLPEIGGEAAYYFDDFDPSAMQLVFEKGMNDFVTNNRIHAIKQQAASFNWDKTVQQYIELYRQLL